MSNKSKKRNKKKRTKAKVEVAALLNVEPNRKIAVLDIKDAPEPKKEISTFAALKNWLIRGW